LRWLGDLFGPLLVTIKMSCVHPLFQTAEHLIRRAQCRDIGRVLAI
jgi:hypothetical protein